MDQAGQAAPLRGEAKRFGDVLKGIIKRKRCRERASYGRLVHAWESVVGEQAAGSTRITAYAEGTLTVEVSCPVLLQELEAFMKPLLLEQLRTTEGGRDLVSIQFRLGCAEGN